MDDLGIQGAFAEYTKLPASQLVRIPDGLSTRVAALAEPLAVALHAMTLARVEPSDRVLVSGAGALGLLLVAALTARGLHDVTVSEPSEARRVRAGRVGARNLLEPHELDTPAMPYDTVDDPYDIVFECSGTPRGMEQGLAQVRRGGTLMLVGAGLTPPTFDHNRILLNELVVTGAFNWDERGFDAALAMLASGELRTEELIEPNDVPLDDLLDALLGLEKRRLVGKVLVVPTQRIQSS
jgi:2-desacetyl-2-hydroxyethyl bacteriochlorophyllide A dehydrogenase